MAVSAQTQNQDAHPFYWDLERNQHPTTWDEIAAAVGRMKAYFQAIARQFVERDQLVEQIMYAMAMREHVLVTGPSGAAKSQLIRTIFSGIRGATIWCMDMTQFTVDTHMFGSYDIRQMQETGQMVHLTDGSIAQANFAQVGEFFDANDAALRSLLGVLNEREVRKGPQVMRPPLITALADTNFDIDSLTAQRQVRLDAVVDRFLFRTSVNYVESPANRLTMLEMDLEKAVGKGLPEVSVQDIVLVSGAVRGMNLVRDPYLQGAYEELTRHYSAERIKAKRPPLSDRRFVRGAQILEISALLNGRREATFEDLAHTAHVLAHTKEDRDLLDKTRATILGEWAAKASRREIEGEFHRLSQVVSAIPDKPDLANMPIAELQRLTAQLDEALTGLNDFQTTSMEVGRRQTELLKRTLELRNQTDLAVLEAVMRLLPDIPQSPPEAELIQLMRQVNNALTHIKRVQPRSDAVIIKRAEFFERVMKDKGTLQTAFQMAQVEMPEEAVT